MLFDLLGFLLLSESDHWFNSAYIVPVAGCLMILGIVAVSTWARVRAQEMRSQERLARIAHGLPLEPEEAVPTFPGLTDSASGSERQGRRAGRSNDGSGARRAGFVLVSIGLGLIGFFFALAVILRTATVFSGGAVGLIPLAIGIGFLVDARLKRRDFEQFYYQQAGQPAANEWAYGGPVAPPPPVTGMTPAQASDWQPPLH